MARTPPALEALRVDLAALRRRGVDQHEVEATLPVPWLQAALRDTDAEVESEGRVSLRLQIQPEEVVVAQGTLSVDFTVPCGRCLAPASVDGDTEIVATFMPSAMIANDPEYDPEEDDPPDGSADMWPNDRPVLSLEPMVSEQVALAYPMRALCERGEACRGLCSNCGYELNALPPAVRTCPQCHNEVPLTPVASGDAAGESRDERKPEGPLAAALRHLDPPDAGPGSKGSA